MSSKILFSTSFVSVWRIISPLPYRPYCNKNHTMERLWYPFILSRVHVPVFQPWEHPNRHHPKIFFSTIEKLSHCSGEWARFSFTWLHIGQRVEDIFTPWSRRQTLVRRLFNWAIHAQMFTFKWTPEFYLNTTPTLISPCSFLNANKTNFLTKKLPLGSRFYIQVSLRLVLNVYSANITSNSLPLIFSNPIYQHNYH